MNDGVPLKIAGSGPVGSETWPRFVIPVFLNDQGPFDFALELHQGKTTLMPECTKELGYEADAIPTIITVPGYGCEIDFPVLRVTLRVGNATLKDFEVMVFKTRDVRYGKPVEEEASEAPRIEMIDAKEVEEDKPVASLFLGILGYDFLKHFKVTFDFNLSRLFLG